MLADIIELSMGMWKYTPERDAKAEFIRALIRGNKSLAYSLREEAGVDSDDILGVFFIREFNSQKVEEAYRLAEKNGNIRIITVTEDEESYGIILRQNSKSEKNESTEIEECINLFDTIKEDKRVRAFHVTGLDGIEGAGDGLRLINETNAFVGNIFPYKRVFSKYELVLVSNCTYIQISGGQLKKNYMDLLEPFRKEGSNKAKQLLETLETFVLDAGMNSAKTSEFLEVHTNTVQYRLKKINEILGVEITGNRVIPGLTVALALRRMENDDK